MTKTVNNVVLLAIVTTLLLGLSACAKNYKLGDTGPAGGTIFYDKGQKTDGWRYLEVAPASTEFKANWGCEGVSVTGTDTAIGSGRKNTEIIASNTSNNPYTAVSRCIQLEVKGYKDWFLPSKDELEQMYKVLYGQNIGGFSGDRYWSSSVAEEEDFSWYQRFEDGFQGGLNNIYSYRDNELTVRAVRAF